MRVLKGARRQQNEDVKSRGKYYILQAKEAKPLVA